MHSNDNQCSGEKIVEKPAEMPSAFEPSSKPLMTVPDAKHGNNFCCSHNFPSFHTKILFSNNILQISLEKVCWDELTIINNTILSNEINIACCVKHRNKIWINFLCSEKNL